MKRLFLYSCSVLIGLLQLALLPSTALAAGITPSGGGSYTVGQTFTVTVRASGATFDSLQGTISVSGPVSIVSFSAGPATWLPGKAPSSGSQFVGITSATSSLTVATIRLKGTKEGNGAVSVSGVRLARSGSEVGSSGGSTFFKIGRALTPPGTVGVSSSTHPDPNTAYDLTTVELSWSAPSNGASGGYSHVFNDSADTIPAPTATTTDTSAKYENLSVGTYYFHIRANNSDGWGPTTHFKINVKEPDAKIDESLTAPTILSAEKSANYTTDIEKGTVEGIVIKGNGGQTGFTLNLLIEPQDRLPKELFEAPETAEGSTAPSLTPLQVVPTETGDWEVAITKPIPSGFYVIRAQNQKDKVLSPLSNAANLEVGVANGGTVKLVTTDDLPKRDGDDKISAEMQVLGISLRRTTVFQLIAGLALFVLIGSGLYYLRVRKSRIS